MYCYVMQIMKVLKGCCGKHPHKQLFNTKKCILRFNPALMFCLSGLCTVPDLCGDVITMGV